MVIIHRKVNRLAVEVERPQVAACWHHALPRSAHVHAVPRWLFPRLAGTGVRDSCLHLSKAIDIRSRRLNETTLDLYPLSLKTGINSVRRPSENQMLN